MREISLKFSLLRLRKASVYILILLFVRTITYLFTPILFVIFRFNIILDIKIHIILF